VALLVASLDLGERRGKTRVRALLSRTKTIERVLHISQGPASFSGGRQSL